MRRRVWIFLFSVVLSACSGTSSYHSSSGQSSQSGGSQTSGGSGSQTGSGSGSNTSGSGSGSGTGSGSGSGSGGQTVSLTGLTVTPPAATIAPTASVSLHATGSYSDGSSKDMTSFVTWSSSNPSVVLVSGAVVATGEAAGSATITATSGSLSATSTITVTTTAATLNSITVSPANSTIPVNTTQQLTATGVYSDGSSSDITALVSWNSSTIANATVSTAGLVTAMAGGSSTITATLASVMGTTTVTVSAPTITAISVSPDDMTLPIGVGEQFTAAAIYSDGSAQDLVSGVTWSSSDPTIASVDANGLATTVAAGTATITATVGTFTDSSTITVVAAHLLSVAVSPATVSMASGTQQQFTATGVFDDGSTQVLTPVEWSSSASSVMTVDANGLGQALTAGSSTVTATSGAVSGTSSVTVTSATLVSLAISPLKSNMPSGAMKQFTATGTFSDNSTQDLTLLVQWSSSSVSVATIDNTGLVSSVAAGSTTIGASYNSISQTTTLTVSTVDLVSITISPLNPTIEVHTSVKFTAVGTYSDGSTATLISVSWRSSKNNLANMHGGSGILRAKKAGKLTVTASALGLSGSTSVTIGGGTLVSVAITPVNASVSAGATQQYVATGTFSDGSTQDVSINSHWSSSTPSVATIANAPVSAGLAKTYSSGTSTIGLNHSGITATGVTLTVN